MSSSEALRKRSQEVKVKITDGPHSGESFVLNKESFTIGRGAENDVVLPNDPKLSRNHIKISFDRETLVVENLSVRNPILYKDNYESKIEPNPSDNIRIGETELQLVWEAVAGERTLQVSSETMARINAEKTVVHAEPPEPVKFSVVPPLVAPPGSEVANKIQPISNGQLGSQPQSSNKNLVIPGDTGKSLDFKGAKIGGKSGIPEVIYTPTSGGVIAPQRSDPFLSPASQVGVKSPPRRAEAGRKSKGNPVVLIAIAAILIVGVILFSDDGKKPRKPSPIKDTDQIATELNKSSLAVEAHVKEKHLTENGQMERQFESAQAYYIKGFRDYRQGQFGRAIMSFQAAISFDPNHTLAREYLSRSIQKQSSVIQFNLNQARAYRFKNNFKFCRSAAQQVMILKKDQNDPQYKDAKKLFDECDTLSKGRF